MPFGIVGWTGPGTRQVAGFGIGPRKGVLLGANLGRAIVTNGDFSEYVCYSAATRPSSQITLVRRVIYVICNDKTFLLNSKKVKLSINRYKITTVRYKRKVILNDTVAYFVTSK